MPLPCTANDLTYYITHDMLSDIIDDLTDDISNNIDGITDNIIDIYSIELLCVHGWMHRMEIV